MPCQPQGGSLTCHVKLRGLLDMPCHGQGVESAHTLSYCCICLLYKFCLYLLIGPFVFRLLFLVPVHYKHHLLLSSSSFSYSSYSSSSLTSSVSSYSSFSSSPFPYSSYSSSSSYLVSSVSSSSSSSSSCSSSSSVSSSYFSFSSLSSPSSASPSVRSPSFGRWCRAAFQCK